MKLLHLLGALLISSILSSAPVPSLGGIESDDSYKFTHLGSSNHGLSYNAVKCMVQDSRGFIWIGTFKGLNRYDGTRVKTYGRHALGVASDFINCLAEDSTGNILIGTDNGVVIYDYVMDRFRLPVHSELLDDRVYAMCRDSNGMVWIGARSEGIFCYNPASDELYKVEISTPDGTVVENIYRIVVDYSDRLYVASYCDNLYYLDAENRSVAHPVPVKGNSDYFENDNIEGLAFVPQSGSFLLVASKRHGLCGVNTKIGTVSRLCQLAADTRPVGLHAEGRNIWLSTTSGLVRYDFSDGSSRTLRYDSDDRFSLSDDHVTAVLCDADGGLWVGTAYGGVNYHGPHQDIFRKFYRTSGNLSLEGCVVSDFAEDRHGNVWISTERRGLLFFDPSEGRLIRYGASSSLPEHINALCCEGDYLWIGYHKGVCRLDMRSGVIKSYPHFMVSDADVDNRVLDIFFASDGTMYVATSIGVMSYDAVRDSFVKVECLGSEAVENIVEDSRGTVWVASYNHGVYAYDPVRDTVTSHWCIKDGIGCIPEMTSSMCIDDKGQVWTIGFSSGFFKYNVLQRDFEAFDCSSLPSLPTEVFFTALPDDDGNLWLSSDKGLVVFNDRTRSVKVFTVLSGLLDDDFRKAGIRLKDGSMLFGSSNGFIMFNPADLQSNEPVTEVAVTDLIVGDEAVVPSENGLLTKNIDVTDNVRLKADGSSFGFTFSAPGSGRQTGSRVLCRLEGYDGGWHDVSANMEIFYYNIPAGSYSFKTVVANEHGQNIVAHKDIAVEVEPKFWQSRSGILLIVFLVLGTSMAVFFIVYRRQEKLHREKQEQMAKDKEIETLQEKMTFFSNVVHEIKTPLTLIRTPLHNIMSSDDSGGFKEDLDIISNSTDYLDQLVKELLEFVRVEQHGYVLDCRNVDIVDRISYMCFNFSELAKSRNLKLSFSYEPETIVLAADTKAINKILNNLLHNAVKYAESYIKISAGIEGNDVVVTFVNDGPLIPKVRRTEIFKPFVQFSNEHVPYSQSFGIGLSLARTLAGLHGGSLTLADTEETRFILTLPFRTVAIQENTEDVEKDDFAVNQSLPLLLLVEDNYELQTYLKRKLKPEYNVFTASSGEKALGLLKRYKVDMVLTDIALQGMSGVDLCRKISSDFDTSHIPVIVLSAISSVETKIRCMEYGVAHYIEKPFTLDYLMACIRGVLNKRSQLKAAWSEKYPSIDVKTFNLVDRDEEFLCNLDRIIRENMSDPSFTVKQLEEALFMSRSSLTRKMRGLLNTKPVDYLCNRRLAEAASMLRSGRHRINEVCYAAGFSTPSYFAKCFRAAYGKLPSEYAAEHQGEATDETNSSTDTTI